MAAVACIGCGAMFADQEGPTHRYMESSPGCWAVYGEVVAREYSDLSYASLHRLKVDAYAVQHPRRPSAQSIQSVARHLMSLCLVLERRMEPGRATAFLQAAAEPKGRFVWLVPPASRGAVTVKDVHRAESATEHKRLVRAWAESAWSAWSPHHAAIGEWLAPVLDARPFRLRSIH
jgi:hypothetical protein